MFTFQRAKPSRLAVFFIVVFGPFISFHATANDLNPSKPQSYSSQQVHMALSLEAAIDTAINNDPWLAKSMHQQNALMASSIALSELPDPVLSMSFANLPTDGFAFDQEPMTQFKAGVSQMFGRGDSLSIKREQEEQVAMREPLLRKNREAATQVQVASLWLDIFRLQQSIALIERDRALFEQLSDVVQASYAAALGSVRQQDLVRAELELTRLNDRLTQMRLQQDQAKAQLLEWLVGSKADEYNMAFDDALLLPEQAPNIVSIPSILAEYIEQRNYTQLAEYLSQHPQILAIEQSVQAGQTGVKLAEQAYKPQWGVNASYAYRADDPSGRSRADFFSVGVTVDLPLFTQSRQDQKRTAAISEAEALKTEKRLAIRAMMSQVKSLFAKHRGLQQRHSLYTQSILVQMREQAEAALNAYTNDDGDFAEVVRARIDDLNARIDKLSIDAELLKSKVQLHYYTAGDTTRYSQGLVYASPSADSQVFVLKSHVAGAEL
jgi:outer membrane protein TolC